MRLFSFKTISLQKITTYYCLLVFLISFVISYFLIPHHVLRGWTGLLAITFMFSFAFSITCVVRNIKERIQLARTYQGSLFGAIATGFGILALQVCSSNGFLCGSGFIFGAMSALLPKVFFEFFQSYSIVIIVLGIITQLLSLRHMKCFSTSRLTVKI